MQNSVFCVSAVLQAMHWTVGVKTASLKLKALIYQLICDPPLAAGHELWAVTERMRSWMQAAEMSFLCRVPGFRLRRRVKEPDQVVRPTDYIPLEVFQGGCRSDPEQTRERLGTRQGGAGKRRQESTWLILLHPRIRSRTRMLMTWTQRKSSQDLNCPCPVILGLNILGFFSSHKVTLTSTHRTVIVSLLVWCSFVGTDTS